MRVYSSYSVSLNHSTEAGSFAITGGLPTWMHRLAQNETFTFGYILAGAKRRPDGRTNNRPVPCISAVKPCEAAAVTP
jgi:hypothetical protein